MLYLKALREGLDDLPPADPHIRSQITAEAREHGWPALHSRLREIDPITAHRLPPHDAQRIGRALEVYAQTGQPLSSFHGKVRVSNSRPQKTLPLISLEPRDRAWLHARIALRFQAMLQEGLVEEVQRLSKQPGIHGDLPAMRCVGYRQVMETLGGNHPWKSLAERGIAATRQLAKRQMTWLRSMQRTVIPCDAEDTFAQLQRAIQTLMDENPASADAAQ